jgi:hypothetical protein
MFEMLMDERRFIIAWINKINCNKFENPVEEQPPLDLVNNNHGAKNEVKFKYN